MPITRRCLEIIKSIKNWPQWQVSDWHHVKFECYVLQFLSNFEIEIINLSSGTEAEMKNVAYKNKSHESLESSAHDFLYLYGFWIGLKLFSVSVLWVRLFIAWILLVCVCVCVCVCACVCVCVYTLPLWSLLPTARRLRHTWGIRINDAMLWVSFHVLLQVPSSPFLNVLYFTSEDETPARRKLKRKRYKPPQKDGIYWYRI